MTARVVRVSGERLSEFLRQPSAELTGVEVTSSPPSWAPLKPALVRFARAYRERGAAVPSFSGVPSCLFGSEWQGFKSRGRTTPARGRCIPCLARDACGFAAEVPAELLPISGAALLQRWREYRAALRCITGGDQTSESDSMLEKIVGLYRGPVSLEPSVLLSDGVDTSVRFVVFPHHSGTGDAARAQYEDTLDGIAEVLAAVGSNPSRDLLDALRDLAPSPLPVGLDGRDGAWCLKMYLRLEDKTPQQRQSVVDAISRIATGMDPVPGGEVQMLGVVLDQTGLLTVKAYIPARPSKPGAPGFPTPLPEDHRLVALAGDQALATLDLWCRGARRSNKWDFNLRDHYLAGDAAAALLAEIASSRVAAQLRPLLVGSSYRADIVAVGVRQRTLALYVELN